MDPEPGEEVFFHGHPSWRSMPAFHTKGLVAAVVAGVIAGIVTRIASGSVSVPWVVAAVLIVFVLVFVTGLIRRIATTYTITNRRLTIETGLLSRRMHETRLERVFRVGTVDFDTAGSGDFDFAFRGVGSPREIVRTVDRALHDMRHVAPQV